MKRKWIVVIAAVTIMMLMAGTAFASQNGSGSQTGLQPQSRLQLNARTQCSWEDSQNQNCTQNQNTAQVQSTSQTCPNCGQTGCDGTCTSQTGVNCTAATENCDQSQKQDGSCTNDCSGQQSSDACSENHHHGSHE
ncbi:MAG: hypothetical protein ACOYB8_09970 [Eubacteriaceae bacterium]